MKRTFLTLMMFILPGFILAGCLQPTPAAVTIPTQAPQVQAVPPTATQPAPAQVPTATAEAPLSIASREFTDSGKTPVTYEVKISYPYLEGPDRADVTQFNQKVRVITDQMTADFKTTLKDALADDFPNGPTGFSSLQGQYEVKSSAGGLISVYFRMSQYIRGAAHPFPFSTTLNYSTKLARAITLEELFKPGTNYLQVLSDSCINELKKNEWFTFPEGAEPKAENYRNWNITPQGLLITFDPYQVAAYAVGFQTVTVPWETLKPLLDPAGPLGEMAQ